MVNKKMTLNISCIFGIHKDLKVLGVSHFTDTSFNLNIPTTKITYLCRDCKKVFVKKVDFQRTHFKKEDLE